MPSYGWANVSLIAGDPLRGAPLRGDTAIAVVRPGVQDVANSNDSDNFSLALQHAVTLGCHIIVDIAAVKFISSAALAAIFRAHKSALECSLQLCIVHGDGPMKGVTDILTMPPDVFVGGSIENALKYLQGDRAASAPE